MGFESRERIWPTDEVFATRHCNVNRCIALLTLNCNLYCSFSDLATSTLSEAKRVFPINTRKTLLKLKDSSPGSRQSTTAPPLSKLLPRSIYGEISNGESQLRKFAIVFIFPAAILRILFYMHVLFTQLSMAVVLAAPLNSVPLIFDVFSANKLSFCPRRNTFWTIQAGWVKIRART